MNNLITNERIGENVFSVSMKPSALLPILEYDEKNITSLTLDGIKFDATARFIKSLIDQLHIPSGVFGFFPPEEVMKRALDIAPSNLALRITMDMSNKMLQGVVKDDGHPLPIAYIEESLRGDPRLKELQLWGGDLVAMLDMKEEWEIPNDSVYSVAVRCRVPLDGIEPPDMTLASIRQICSNGAVAESPLYRTKLVIKDNSGEHFRRLVASFSNPVCIEMLHGRVSTAAETLASVRELLAFEGFICKALPNPENQMKIRARLYEIAGNPCGRYGVADLTTIGEKKRQLLPVDCTVSDLVNIASELTTHYPEYLSRADLLFSFMGGAFSKGFDLEEIYPTAKGSADYYLKDLRLMVA